MYDVNSGVSKIVTLQGRTLDRLVMGISCHGHSSHGLHGPHAPLLAKNMDLPALGRYLLDACEEGLLHVVRMPYGAGAGAAGAGGVKKGLNHNNNNTNNDNDNNNNDSHPKAAAPGPLIAPALPPVGVGAEVEVKVGIGAGGASRPVSGANGAPKGVGFSVGTMGGDFDGSAPGPGLAQGSELVQGPGLGQGEAPSPMKNVVPNAASLPSNKPINRPASSSSGSKEGKGLGLDEGEETRRPSSSQLLAAVSFEFKLPRPPPLEWRVVDATPPLVHHHHHNDDDKDDNNNDEEEEKDPILTPRTPLPRPQVITGADTDTHLPTLPNLT